MARARDVPVDPLEPFRAAAARAVRVRSEEVFEHMEGVLDLEDPERVHDMRVATRRLRAALEVFAACFAAKPHRTALADVKRLADALGERRDPDVHVVLLTAWRNEGPARSRRALDGLISERARDRRAGNERLQAELDRLRTSDLAGRLAALARSAS